MFKFATFVFAFWSSTTLGVKELINQSRSAKDIFAKISNEQFGFVLGEPKGKLLSKEKVLTVPELNMNMIFPLKML